MQHKWSQVLPQPSPNDPRTTSKPRHAKPHQVHTRQCAYYTRNIPKGCPNTSQTCVEKPKRAPTNQKHMQLFSSWKIPRALVPGPYPLWLSIPTSRAVSGQSTGNIYIYIFIYIYLCLYIYI